MTAPNCEAPKRIISHGFEHAALCLIEAWLGFCTLIATEHTKMLPSDTEIATKPI